MNAVKVVSVVAVGTALLSGCFTMSREDVAKEYERVVSLPPAERILSPNKAVDDVGRMSFDSYNFSHPLLKQYVAATTNHREYTGFMNDVQFVMKDEGLGEEAAMAKVAALVQEEDKTRADAEKVWPKIQEGWAAANALDPAAKLAEIAILAARNAEIAARVNGLPKVYANEDFIGKAQRGAECGMISAQLAQTAEILGFLGEQYRRVQQLKNYRK